MAFPVTLNGRTYTLADFEGTNYVDGFPDALEDFVTQAGDIYNDTSSTSETIGTGPKTFTVSSGKPYQEGTPLRIADAASPDENFLDCVVTSYSGTALTVNAFGFAGSGTFSSWTINIGGAKTVDGTLAVNQGGTGSTSASGARTNLDVYSKSEANSRFLDVSGEASDVTMNGNVTIGDSSADTLQVNATATLEDATLVTADINDGTIDGTVIGGNSPAAGTFTTVSANSFSGISSSDLPAGSVIQVVQSIANSEVQQNSTSFASTGLSGSITPKSQTSKILVMADQQSEISRGVRSQGVGYKIERNGVTVQSFTNSLEGFFRFDINVGSISNIQIGGVSSLKIIDTPSTTSSITYEVFCELASTADGGTVRHQRSNAPSTITLMEIAG